MPPLTSSNGPIRRREFLSLLAGVSIPDLMREHGIPTASIAWIRAGVVDGNFTLDEDVNGKLVSWQVPDNEFTLREKVTLRRLLSHTAGLTVHGFPGYAAGSAVPSLRQVLDGEKPANTASIRVDMVPGRKMRYSDGGYAVMQQLLLDRMEKTFPELMAMMVLKPLRMTRSTFEQPLPAGWAGGAAVAHDEKGKAVAGRWHTYPEMAAAGLWTTPSDLARFAAEIWRASRGEGGSVLQPGAARLMLTPQMGNYGLGLTLQGSGDDLRFGHGGSNRGYQYLWELNAATGDGFVMMTNSGAGQRLFGGVREKAAQEFRWRQ